MGGCYRGCWSHIGQHAPAALTENTWFRRVVTARDASDPGVSCVDITNTVLVSVIDFDPGIITEIRLFVKDRR